MFILLFVTGFLERVNEKAEFFPDNDDLSGAAQALLRLQDTYRLDTTKIATGDIQGIKKSPIMTCKHPDHSH
jgi:prolyl 4-hydroxylase